MKCCLAASSAVLVLMIAGCQGNSKVAGTLDDHSAAPVEYWGQWGPGNDPKVLGRRVVADLLSRDLTYAYEQRGSMSYPEVCTAYGCLRFSGEIKDKELVGKLTKRYEVIFLPDLAYLGPRANNVDNSVFGILPLEVYRQNGATAADKRWLEYGIEYADLEWANPTADGLTRFSRYWVDDMFMVPALQSQAYRVTGNKVYMDRSALEVVAYLKALQQPNGLFFHAADSPYCWGRGNGWFAAGMAEMLSIMPADHPQRAAILEGYRRMMAGLLKYQAKDGMWRELVDIDDSGNWDETSGSGMFIFSMAMGVRYGWLPEETYKEAVKRGWIALSEHMSEDGKVGEVCQGTNKASQAVGPGAGPEMLQYYLGRQRLVGDFHGQAAFIWAAWAMSMEPAKAP